MKVFVGKHCTSSNKLKAWLMSEDIEIDQVIAEDNLNLVKNLNIRSVPTLVLNNNSLIKGVDSIIKYLKGENE